MWLRRLAWPGIALVGLVLVALTVLRVAYHGEALARRVTDVYVNPYIRGELGVRSIDWDYSSVTRLFGDVPARLVDVTVTDPRGKVVLRAQEATGKIDLWALISPWGHHDILVDDLVIAGGEPWALLEEYPSRIPGVTTLGLIDAFEPRERDEEVPPDAEGMDIEVDGLTLVDVDVDIDFYDFHGAFEDVSIPEAGIRYSGRKPAIMDFAFFARNVTTPAGWMALRHCDPRDPDDNTRPVCPEETRVDVRDVSASLVQIRPDDQRTLRFAGSGETTTGARFTSKGTIDGLWVGGGDVAVRTHVENGGGLVSQLTLGLVGGPAVNGELVMSGKFRDPIYTVDGWNLRITGVPVGIDRIFATWESATGDGVLREGVFSLLGGKVRAGGTWGTRMEPLGISRFDIDVTIEDPVELAGFLEANQARLLGGTRLSGTTDVAGTPEDAVASSLQLRVGDARFSGRLRYHEDRLITRNLTVKLPGGKAALAGSVGVLSGRLDVGVAVTADALGPLMQRFAPGLGPHLGAGTGTAEATVTGTTEDPRVTGTAEVASVPGIRQAEASFTYGTGELTVSRFEAAAYGGTLSGSTAVSFGDVPRFEALRLRGSDLSLSRLPMVDGAFDGSVDFVVEGAGTEANYEAEIEATVSRLDIAGVDVGDVRTQLRATDEGLVLHSLHAGRPGKTDSLDVAGQVLYRGPLDLELTLSGFEIDRIPELGEREPAVGGTVGIDARLAGTLDEPEVTGVARAFRVHLGEHLLGGARIELEPWPGGRIHVAGRLFQNKIAIDGWVSPLPPLAGELRVDFRRVELAELLPGVGLEGVDGWASGHADVTLGAAPEITLHIERTAIALESQDEYGRPRPIVVTNQAPIVVRMAQGEVRLLEPVLLHGEPELGDLRVEGSLSAGAMDMRLAGKLQLGILELFTDQWVDDIDGEAEVDLVIKGTPTRPHIEGNMHLGRVVIQPRGIDSDIVIPGGFVRLDSDRISLDDMAIDMDGQRLAVTAQVALSNFEPQRIDARVSGRLPADMVALVDPASVSNAEGSAWVDFGLRGPWSAPRLEGNITFDAPFELAIRGLGHDLRLDRGQIRVTGGRISIRELGGALDDAPASLEGDPDACDADGFCTALVLDRWDFARVYLALNMTSLVHRVPGILEAELTTQLRLRGNRRGLSLAGNVLVVDGRYFQSFDIVEEVFIPERTAETETPFWEGEPLLANLRLSVQVATNGTFLVQNNLGNLTLDGAVEVTGTLSEPRLDGQIGIRSGTISIPGFRANFQLRTGTMTFYRTQKIPEESPDVFLTAESDFEDRSKQRHIITLRLTGPLGRLVPELWTDTGLNQAQTLNLLISGRTDADEVIRGRDAAQDVAREGALGGSSTLGGSSAFGEVADPFIKEVTGAFIANIIGDPLKKITRLDCVEIEPGIDSWRFYGCKDLARNIRLEGEVEEGFAAGRIDRAGAKYKVTDDATVDLFWQKDTPGEDEAVEVRNRVRLQFKFRFVWKR